MKRIIQFLAFFLLITSVIPCKAQQEGIAAGVWTGDLFNDTTKKFIPFEIAISFHNGKYSGYTYTVFVIDGTENIGVKSVTFKEKDGILIIRDKKLINDNYKVEADKGVFTTLELSYSENDSVDILSGHWFTNRTKEFYPVGGSVMVTKRKNIFATRIIPKLRNLGLLDQLSFYDYQKKPKQETAAKNIFKRKDTGKDTMMTIVEQPVVITIPKKKSPEINLPASGNLDKLLDSLQKKDTRIVAINSTAQKNNKIISPSDENRKERKVEIPAVPDNEVKKENLQETNQQVAVVSKQEAIQPAINKNAQEEVKNNLPSKAEVQKSVTRPTQVIASTEIKSSTEKKQDTLNKKVNPVSIAANQSGIQKAIAKTEVPVLPQIDISKRKIETIRTVSVSGDSLVLSLFDNGIVDGDTVSVLINGEVVLSKIGLLTTAYNKTIHLTPEMGDSIKIILYAENLGSIPPNTGLLVLRNAGQDYEIRFTGDLQRNSAIILLRKKEQ